MRAIASIRSTASSRLPRSRTVLHASMVPRGPEHRGDVQPNGREQQCPRDLVTVRNATIAVPRSARSPLLRRVRDELTLGKRIQPCRRGNHGDRPSSDRIELAPEPRLPRPTGRRPAAPIAQDGPCPGNELRKLLAMATIGFPKSSSVMAWRADEGAGAGHHGGLVCKSWSATIVHVFPVMPPGRRSIGAVGASRSTR